MAQYIQPRWDEPIRTISWSIGARIAIRLSLIVPGAGGGVGRSRSSGSIPTMRRGICRAWFIDDATHMNPNLLYGQARSRGNLRGRGTGIIDTLHFVEVARAASRVGL